MKNYLSSLINKIIQPRAESRLLESGSKAGVKNTAQGHASETAEATSAAGRPIMDSLCCPYCQGREFVRRGMRTKKRERVQLYLCGNCRKTFTPLDLKAPTFKPAPKEKFYQIQTTSFVPLGGDLTGFTPHSIRGKHYPLTMIFDAISLYPVRKIPGSLPHPVRAFSNGIYNLGYGLEEACGRVSRKLENPTSNFQPPTSARAGMSATTLSNWLNQFDENLPFSRMREFAVSKFLPAGRQVNPQQMVITATLAHRQLYPVRGRIRNAPAASNGVYRYL